MYIYNYDSYTKEYIGFEEASLDPQESINQGRDIYLIPANCSLKEPPTPQEHEIVIFDEGLDSWRIISDYRGMYMVNADMQPLIIAEKGNLPSGYIAISAKQAATIQKDLFYYVFAENKIVVNPNYVFDKLQFAKAQKIAENDSKAAQSRYSKEFTLILQDKVCVFDTKETTQADLLTAFAVCSTGATYDGWITNNGIEIDLTFEDVATIAAEFKEKSNVYGQWAIYKRAIDSAQTLEEVEAIKIDYD